MSARVKKLKEDIHNLLLDTVSGDEEEGEKNKVVSVEDIPIVSEPRPKPKRVMTEETKLKLKTALKAKNDARKEKIREEEEKAKEEFEETIVKKALAIKRKKLKQQMILEAISDDSDTEIPLERVKSVIKEVKKQKDLAPDEKVKKVIQNVRQAPKTPNKPVSTPAPAPKPADLPPVAPPKPQFVFFSC